MVGILIISENKQADEMLKTVKRLLGVVPGLKSLILPSEKSVESMEAHLCRALKSFEKMKGVILLVDIYGSTQSNMCMKFVKKGSVGLLSGFNLPLLIKLGALNKKNKKNKKVSLKTLLSFAESYGKDHLMHILDKKGPQKK